jgi:hypothetical protein
MLIAIQQQRQELAGYGQHANAAPQQPGTVQGYPTPQ